MTHPIPLSQRAAAVRPQPCHDDTTTEAAPASDAPSAPDSQAKPRPFSPDWIAGTDKAKALVTFLRDEILAYEELAEIRKRARKKCDQEAFDFMVERLVCDLCRYHLASSAGGLRISRSNSAIRPDSKYHDPTHTKTRNALLDMMDSDALRLIEMNVGGRYWTEDQGLISTIAPGHHLKRAIARFGVAMDDFSYAPVGQTVFLKRQKEDHWDKPVRIEYDDTAQVIVYRDEMERINAHLARAELSLLGPVSGRPVIDLSNRFMRRGFSCGSFSNGGRLHVGFWQGMSKEDRFSQLRINGGPVVEVDFRQMLPRILYAEAGVVPQMDDLYAIPCFTDHRDGVKALLCAMLFGTQPLKRFPKGLREKFPAGTKVGHITANILMVHGPIRHLFHCGAGHRGQFTESQILVSVLLELNRRGVTALPVHDAVLVPAACAGIAKEVMLDQFRHHTGGEGMVKVEVGATV